MLGLPTSDNPTQSTWSTLSRATRRYSHKAAKGVMRSYHYRLPKYDVPVRVRPWFFMFTCLVMLILAFLGFTNFSHGLPINDKLLHFFCLMIATGVFYFIFDIEEDARRIWWWRYAPLILTGSICFVLGGIVSEFVQSMLPYKEFQLGDVAANLLGSSIGLWIAYNLERYYRHRREISRLYRPLNDDVESLPSDEEDEEAGTQLLPTHVNNGAPAVPKNTQKSARIGNVWDEREELFDIGEESDEEGGTSQKPTHSGLT